MTRVPSATAIRNMASASASFRAPSSTAGRTCVCRSTRPGAPESARRAVCAGCVTLASVVSAAALRDDARDAWHIVVSSAAPPISAAKNGNGWVMSSAYGPNYDTSGSGVELSLVGNETGGATRVVVSCFGDGSISGSIGVGAHEGDPVDPFTLDCNVEHAKSVTLARTYPDAGQVHVIYDPHGATVWGAVTIHIRDPGPPPP